MADYNELKRKGFLSVIGARVNNLKNVDVFIPHNSLTVITGMSGSGKSSLAFDTIFAEGRRRYIATLSVYARNFVGEVARPDVDMIYGLNPVIAIEQKTVNRNPRSTVGTVTEVSDFLRLLYARAGEAYSYITGEKMIKYTEEKILTLLLKTYNKKDILILAPIVNDRKGHYKELFEQIGRKGYLNVRVDGEIKEIQPGMKLDRYKTHTIEVVIDHLTVSRSEERRIKSSLTPALKLGGGMIHVFEVKNEQMHYYSCDIMDPETGLSYGEPEPHNFSFNSPYGACRRCKGLGYVNMLDMTKIVPDSSLSIYGGGILALGKYKSTLIFWQIEAICEKYGVTIKTPIAKIPDDAIDEIMNGTEDRLHIKNNSLGANSNYFMSYEGVAKYIMIQQDSEASAMAKRWAGQFITTSVCPECKGLRLNKEALHYKIGGKNIAELSMMGITELSKWLVMAEKKLMSPMQRTIAAEALKEVHDRLNFMIGVGLDYITLNREAASLSGGESQRMRLSTHMGSRLVNILYILDEPSIGLHQRDNARLIESLKKLRDSKNSIIVVEHDRDMMMSADFMIDIGPGPGPQGGEIVFAGTPEEMLKADTLTSSYLNGKRSIALPERRRIGNGKFIRLLGASGNNLKNVDVDFPLGTFICVTGVSGSGKSTLINHTLQPILSKHFYHSLANPLDYHSIEGLEHIDKVIDVDQSPIGRTPRSNPATYTGIFNDIREIFAGLPESKIRGYKAGRFSCNMEGGRCEECKGSGYIEVEMNLLPGAMAVCDACDGKRYNRETQEIRYRGRSVADVLDMTVDMAADFFRNVPAIHKTIVAMQTIGLGYVKLGQAATTLSGGECQRVKLAAELSRRDTGNTLYILDEPTTGLHFEDIRLLLSVFNKLVNRGNTVVVIEHNMDIIKSADYLIDMGPGGGDMGGRVLYRGTPERMLVSHSESYTTPYLRQALEGQN
ncbi:MAG: excinuclease ABC subunit UvrA [Tannerellaceae bacterium]|jgi:excinuclease ABC subunit A|nr:excinuclease ABC subunit UvrA [Tannerellaceae bacterium]